VGHPKTGFVKKISCPHQPSTTGSGNTNKKKIGQFTLTANQGSDLCTTDFIFLLFEGWVSVFTTQ